VPAEHTVPVLSVPAVVRNKAVALGASAWLRALPGLVADLAEEWEFTVGRAFGDATEAFVAEVFVTRTCGTEASGTGTASATRTGTGTRRPGGTPAVLKLLIPRPAGGAPSSPAGMPGFATDVTRNEITVLRIAGGSGCARLLRSDESRGALLLERLGRSLHDLALPTGQRHEILCATASRVWRPAPDAGLPTGADKGRWLIAFITRMWEELGRPCSERATAAAIAGAEHRIAAHDDERAVLVHGDVHQWNALEASHGTGAGGNEPGGTSRAGGHEPGGTGAGGFKLVDPDGLLAEPEYDLGILMREDPLELMTGDPRERARWLARRCGLDATAIWEWGLAERVSTGLLLTQVGLQPMGDQMLAAADHVSGIE
jgi:streptomycin 6-kinase